MGRVFESPRARSLKTIALFGPVVTVFAFIRPTEAGSARSSKDCNGSTQNEQRFFHRLCLEQNARVIVIDEKRA